MLDLQPHLGIDPRPVVADFLALEAVSALVIIERFGVLGSIFQCLAQRKAQVVAIDELGRAGSFMLLHSLDLGFFEAVSLEVGETPVSVAEIWRDAVGTAIGVDSLGLPANRLERVTDRQVQRRIIRHFAELRAVNPYCLIEFTDRKALVGIKQVELRFARGLAPQHLRLLQRFTELLSFVEHVDVVKVGVGIIRLKHNARFEQEFGLVIGTEFGADFSEQAHRLGMVTMLLKVSAAQVFRFTQTIFLDQPDHCLQFAG